jgi:hypothetical protein
MDWKTIKGDRTWSNNFKEQPNKWGYLNNPRWKVSPQAPVDYNKNEVNEPQVWNLPGKIYSSVTSNRHLPCGHWHKTQSSVIPSYEGQVYICDYTNHRVFVYTTKGVLVRILEGSVTGNFAWPVGVYVYEDEVYVTERYGAIVVTDLFGTYKREWAITPCEPYFNNPEGPIGQVRSLNNEFYVPITSEARINVYNSVGTLIRHFDTPADGTQMIDGQVQTGHWTAFYLGKLYVSYIFKVQVLNPLATGTQTPSRSWGHWGNDNGGFYGMQGIVAVDNKVYVCDNNNSRIQVFDLSGNYLSQFGNGAYFGISEYGNELYVADQSSAGVQVWSLDGVYKRGWFVSAGWVQGIYVYTHEV